MKKIAFTPSILLLICVLAIFASCKKSNDPEPASFTWTHDGTNYTANIKTAYLYSMSVGPVIIAGTGTSLLSPGTGPTISVNSLGIGTYTFGAGASNSFTYVSPNGNILMGDIVTLNITGNSNNLLSGNFSGTLKDPSNFSFPIAGSFTNIPIEN